MIYQTNLLSIFISLYTFKSNKKCFILIKDHSFQGSVLQCQERRLQIPLLMLACLPHSGFTPQCTLQVGIQKIFSYRSTYIIIFYFNKRQVPFCPQVFFLTKILLKKKEKIYSVSLI